MSKVPLARQIAAGKLLVSDGDIQDQEAVSALWKTLLWMERNEEHIKAGAELMKHEAVKAIYEAFPGTRLDRIVDVTVPQPEAEIWREGE